MTEIKIKWPLIVEEYDKIYFNYIDLGNFTMFRMAIFKTCTPRHGLWVSIEHKGAFFFSMDNELHKDYVAIKLCLLGDSGNVADFLNTQIKKYKVQQGSYSEKAIHDREEYGQFGEDKIITWCPEII